VNFEWLGQADYQATLERQRAYREQVIEGTAPETIWLLEHPSTITLGRRKVEDVQTGAARLAGVQVVQTERGGLATWHGPGQLVGYLFVRVGDRPYGTREFVNRVEQGLIDWAESMGLAAGRREGFPGVWVGQDKIAAIGMHMRKGVSMHGIALNLNPSFEGFGFITPCGITDGGVTSVARLLGHAPSSEQAGPGVARAVWNRIDPT